MNFTSLDIFDDFFLVDITHTSNVGDDRKDLGMLHRRKQMKMSHRKIKIFQSQGQKVRNKRTKTNQGMSKT